MTWLWIFLGIFFGFSSAFSFSFLKLTLFTAVLIYVCLRRQKLEILGYVTSSLIGILIVIVIRRLPVLEQIDNLGFVVTAKENYVIVVIKGVRYYVYGAGNTYETGDLLYITGYSKDLSFTHYESRFDFAGYLRDNGVDRQIVASSIELIRRLLWPRKKMMQSFLSSFDGSQVSLIRLILFDEADYDNRLIGFLGEFGLIGIISMSGTLIQFVPDVGVMFLSRFVKKEKAVRWRFVFLLPFLPYGFQSVVYMRILLTSLLYFLDKKENMTPYNRLGIVNISLVTLNIYNINSLSLIAGLSLTLMLYQARHLLNTYGKIRKYVFTQVLIYMTLLPLMVWFDFGLNILSVLLYLPAMMAGKIYFFLSYVMLFTFRVPLVLKPFTVIFGMLPDIAGNRHAFIAFGEVSGAGIILWYSLIALIIYARQLRIKRFYHSLSLMMPVFLVFQIVPFGNLYREEVHFIDVGQGDSTLIVNKKEAVLIDTGGNLGFDMATETLIPFFRKKKIQKLSAVIITHHDFDHDGALDSLKAHFRVDKVVTSVNDFPLDAGNLYFENLNGNTVCTDDNDCSLVIKYRFKSLTWLVMGDAPVSVDEKIMETNPGISADIIKISHHGSRTGTYEPFIRSLEVKEAVISVGKNNMYRHPNEEVLAILQNNHIRIRRTDLEGTISYC